MVSDMSRRKLLIGGAGVAGAVVAGWALYADDKPVGTFFYTISIFCCYKAKKYI